MNIENEKVDVIHLKLNSILSVFRTLEGENIDRFKSIYKTISFLNKNHFNFQLTHIKQKKHIDLLSEGKGKYRWNPMGCELIRFEEWFMEQL